MRYYGRELRRLYEIELFNGDREDPNVTTRTERVIAWNEVDAIRRAAVPVASMPVRLGHVTWPDSEDDPIYMIHNTRGPTDVVADPTIALNDGWDF